MLGQEGGVVSPSVYDTAQLLQARRHEPPRAGLGWLLREQAPDGGWGAPAVPLARDVPTLAAVLALHTAGRTAESKEAVRAGLDFLRRHAPVWEESLPDDAPVAVELILPWMLDKGADMGLDVPVRPYIRLRELGERRHRLIQKMRPGPGTAPSHAWEVWGTDATPDMLDGSGGVGHSPAATAAWLSRHGSVSERDVDRARSYLKGAGAATLHDDASGIVPTVWPIDRFEQVWGLYALLATGLLEHPALSDVVSSLLVSVKQALRPEGIGMSDHFIHDGDITATTVAVLAGAGREVDMAVLNRFRRDDGFITYANELQPSLTTNAHAVLALALLGQDATRPLQRLREAQGVDGRWSGDKWHGSWLYTTSQVMVALATAGDTGCVARGVDALLRHQHGSGGWGMNADATPAETAYAVHALHAARSRCAGNDAINEAMRGASVWLSRQLDHSLSRNGRLWIGKELYCPHRVDQAFELSARLMLHLDPAMQ